MRKWLLSLMLGLILSVGLTGNVFAGEPYEAIASEQEWQVLKIVNRERITYGLEPISTFKKIQQAAGVRADEISYYFSHTRPDGTSCFTAVKELGIYYSCAGENIAAGYQSPKAVMTGWMNSDGHRGNILGSGYDHVGIGYATGGSYGKNWVQDFVGGCSVTSVKSDGKGTLNYPVGTTVDAMNRYLVVMCSEHGVGYVPVIGEMCSGYNPNAGGAQTITVEYGGKKVKIPVTVGNAPSVTKPGKVRNFIATKSTKSTVSLRWSKQDGKGYEIWYATKKNGKYKKARTITSADKKACKVRNLKSGKRYYFKIRAYKKANNEKIYGSFSKAVVVKTK